MAYNNRRNDSRPANGRIGVKPVTKVLPLVIASADGKGREYDANSAVELISFLQDHSVFDKLSVDATMSKRICFDNPEAKGSIPVARIHSFDKETMELSVTLYGKNTNFADKITENMIIVPRVRVDRDSNKVITINAFEIVEG